MGILEGFSEKDTIEQIILLDEIKEQDDKTVLSELFDIYATPLGDQAVDEMVYHTLFNILRGQTQEIINGFSHSDHSVQLICIRSAVDNAPPELQKELLDLLGRSNNTEIMAEILRALANFEDKNLVEQLTPYILHEDCAIMAGALQAVIVYNDILVRDNLIKLISESDEVKGDFQGCSLRTAIAISNLAKFTDDHSVGVMVEYIHHRNPSFRREIISAIASMGKIILPALINRLEHGDKDEKIMAANIIGMVGHRSGADVLVDSLVKIDDQNLKFALYEALGRITSLRSLTGLADGLAEENELVLMAVITGLENLFNPGVIKIILEKNTSENQAQFDKILKAVIAGRAVKTFMALYHDGTVKEKLMTHLVACKDHEAMDLFRCQLENLNDENAAADINRLAISEAGPLEKRILAADDSKAMLFFYKGVASLLGMDIVTVEDGRQALDHLQLDSNFDLIITDMNMPNMDGIELAREIRKNDEWQNLPLLMATTESESSQAKLAKEAGIDDFITKPFTKEVLKEKVEGMLG